MSYEYDPQRIAYFGATDSRNRRIPFGIRAEDRMRHMYVIGKTGMGKSTMLENLAIQDIQNGEGICFIDPHGQTAEKLLEFVPEHRINDVIYFAPFDTDFPLGFNVMEDVGADKRHLVVAGLMSSFKRIWVDMWSARMEYILQNVLLALLEYPDTTLIDVNRMLINKKFREKVVEYVTDPIVKRFWVEEFAGYTDRYTQEATPAIQNKIGQFASNPLVRNIIGQSKSTFDIRESMDSGKILIVNLSKGRMGEQNADLLGSMLVTKIYLSAMSRAEMTPMELAQVPPFYLYVDEFQSVVNDSFANILSEARKYKLALTIAHQYIEQVEEHIRAAVFGNAGTIVTFRVGPFDAEVLKTVFEPTFFAEDLVNLGAFQIYLTLMIDQQGSKPFSATTLPAVEDPPKSYVSEIIEASRRQFGRPRVKVEEHIRGVDETLPPGGFEKPSWNGNVNNAKKKKKNKPPSESSGQDREHKKRNDRGGGHDPGNKETRTQEVKRQQEAPQNETRARSEEKKKDAPRDMNNNERTALRDAIHAIRSSDVSTKKGAEKITKDAPLEKRDTQRSKETQDRPKKNKQNHEQKKPASSPLASHVRGDAKRTEVPKEILDAVLKNEKR